MAKRKRKLKSIADKYLPRPTETRTLSTTGKLSTSVVSCPTTWFPPPPPPPPPQ